jgi:hypothetical protein
VTVEAACALARRVSRCRGLEADVPGQRPVQCRPGERLAAVAAAFVAIWAATVTVQMTVARRAVFPLSAAGAGRHHPPAATATQHSKYSQHPQIAHPHQGAPQPHRVHGRKRRRRTICEYLPLRQAIMNVRTFGYRTQRGSMQVPEPAGAARNGANLALRRARGETSTVDEEKLAAMGKHT